MSLRIIVAGLIARYPIGGVAWDYLQYAAGFERLGHEVCYHEDTREWPYQPVAEDLVATGDYSAKFLQDLFSFYTPDMVDRWHYCHLNETSFGMSRSAFKEFSRTADFFINVSGASFIPDDLSPHCIKLFVDTDPGYNQIRMVGCPLSAGKINHWCEAIAEHDMHFTLAENINSPDCEIPKVGINWVPTRPPAVLDFWSDIARTPAQGGAPWTTVMNWSDFKHKLYYEGQEYGSKGTEFEKILDLPDRIERPLKVALAGESGRPLLERHGWSHCNGPFVTLTPRRYQDFLFRSRGEVSIAKNVYVALHSGWFSCRSICYLASGRPTVLQDTGFSRLLPIGEGVIAFNTLDEAAAGIEAVEADYERHSHAAIAFADEFFCAEKVLRKILN